MTQGMFSAVSGIRANQTRLNVISNNIANVNTLGFKGSMANFATVFASTFSGGTAANGLLGGTNPRQQGNGVLVAEIASNWGQGGTQFTGRNTDLMINGDGFFAVERVDANSGSNSTDYYLTRAGNFTLDSSGNLVTTAGNRLRGTSQVSGTSVATLGRVNVPLQMVVLKDIDTTNNNAIIGTHMLRTLGPADAGVDYSDTATFPLAAGSDDRTVTSVALRSFSIGSDGSITATYSNGDRIQVRTNESTVNPADPTSARRELIHLPYEGGTYGADYNGYLSGTPNTANTDGMCDQFQAETTTANGLGVVATDVVPGYEVFGGGTSNPDYTTGLEGMQLQLQAATVTNPAGLLYDGNNNFLQGANSGDTDFGVTGSGARGSIQAGALESSNVDLAGEFTNMIISQRGLEAASKAIRTQSEVMQTIIQII